MKSLTLEAYLARHYTPKTVAAYLRDIRAYLQAVSQPETARHPDIVAYLGVMRTRYPKPATLNRIRCSIKAYYDYLHAAGYRADNPAQSVRLKDKPSKDIQLQDLFSPEELQTLLHHPQRYFLTGSRNSVLISLLVYQALLPTEIQQLTLQDIDLEQACLQAGPTPKTHARSLPINPRQLPLMAHYLEVVRPKLVQNASLDQLLITTRHKPMKAEEITKYISRTFGTYFTPRKVHPRSIRQSVIANFLKVGHDIRVVQVFAGHKYPSTTEKYRQETLEELQLLIDQLHPRK